jgi:hypothetical protein
MQEYFLRDEHFAALAARFSRLRLALHLYLTDFCETVFAPFWRKIRSKRDFCGERKMENGAVHHGEINLAVRCA